MIQLPHIYPVRQTAPQPTVADVAGEVRRQWKQSAIARRIKPGDRIAVGVRQPRHRQPRRSS